MRGKVVAVRGDLSNVNVLVRVEVGDGGGAVDLEWVLPLNHARSYWPGRPVELELRPLPAEYPGRT